MRNNKKIQLNEGVVQLVATEVFFLALIGTYWNSIFLFALLTLDFFIRGFTNLPISLLKIGAQFLNAKLLTKHKMVFAPPKLFAARIGCIICFGIVVLYFIKWPLLASVLKIVLLNCAFLEGFFGICMGCYAYQILNTITF